MRFLLNLLPAAGRGRFRGAARLFVGEAGVCGYLVSGGAPDPLGQARGPSLLGACAA